MEIKWRKKRGPLIGYKKAFIDSFNKVLYVYCCKKRLNLSIHFFCCQCYGFHSFSVLKNNLKANIEDLIRLFKSHYIEIVQVTLMRPIILERQDITERDQCSLVEDDCCTSLLHPTEEILHAS